MTTATTTAEKTSGPGTALITGAGSGIGQAVAARLGLMGWSLALFGRESAKLEAVRGKLGLGDRCRVWACDVSDRARTHACIAEVIAEMPPLGVVVSNAGVNIPNRSLTTLDPAGWDQLIAINLTGAYNVIHAVLPTLRAQGGGLVIQICSISGMRAGPLGGIAYSASKYGQAALGIGLGREERQHGIRSTVIYPGEVNTPILDARPNPVPPERRAAILQPEDLADAVGFLVNLNPRAHIFEMVIKPTVDDFV